MLNAGSADMLKHPLTGSFISYAQLHRLSVWNYEIFSIVSYSCCHSVSCPVLTVSRVLFQTLREDLKEQRTSRDYVNKTGNDLIMKASPGEKAARLEQDLKAVNKMWGEVTVAMEERLHFLEETIEQLKEYEVGLILFKVLASLPYTASPSSVATTLFEPRHEKTLRYALKYISRVFGFCDQV